MIYANILHKNMIIFLMELHQNMIIEAFEMHQNKIIVRNMSCDRQHTNKYIYGKWQNKARLSKLRLLFLPKILHI